MSEMVDCTAARSHSFNCFLLSRTTQTTVGSSVDLASQPYFSTCACALGRGRRHAYGRGLARLCGRYSGDEVYTCSLASVGKSGDR